MWANFKNYSDAALLFVRVSLCTIIILVNGWPKLAGGAASWRRFAIREMGVTIWPSIWGFVGAMAETLGCVLIIVGLFSRPACLLLVVVFGLVSFVDFQSGGLGKAAHALELMLIFFALLFVGPGKYSVDKG